MKFYQVSAFSTDPFKGNPAGICVLEKLIDKEEMQKIARVTNLPATAFIFQALDSFQLRWFTPNSELPLCGHATLASAYIIWEKGLLPKTEKIVFHTGNGDLSVRRHDAWMEMEFPSYSNIKTTLPAELLKLFDKNIREVAI